jgi:AcrR family transcriptional regulator
VTDLTASSEAPLRAEEAKLDEIYRAAAQIFHDKGYHATSINEIAESVHLTKAGLYYYIKGKQDLLFRIMNFAMDLLEERVIDPARAIDDPEERLRTLVTEHVRLITMDSSALTILVNELEGLTDEHREHLVGRQRAYVDLIASSLRALKDEGKLADVDPTVGAFALLGMIQWIPRWFRPDGRVAREEIIQQFQRMTLGAVGLDSGS